MTAVLKMHESEFAPPSFLPRRFVMVGLMFLVLSYDFYTRDLMITAATLLLEQSVVNGTLPKNPSCPHLKEPVELYQEVERTNYGWTRQEVAEISRYFYMSYVLTQAPAGYLIEKYMCAKVVVDVSLGASSTLLLITPIVLDKTNGNMMLLKIMRLVHGVLIGVLPPSGSSLIAHWTPDRERATLSSVVHCGIIVGTLISKLATHEIIVSKKNWAAPFYVYGGVGVIISVLWFVFAAASPETSTSISAREKFYLDEQFGNTIDHGKKLIPLGRIMLSRDLWILVIVNTGYMYVWNMLAIFLQSYLREILKLSKHESAIWVCIPYGLMGFFTLGSCIFSDWMINRDYINKTVLRKACTLISTMGGAIYLLAASFASCHRSIAKTLFTIALGLEGFNFAGIRMILFDVSPNYCGFLSGISNSIGICTAFLIRILEKKIAPNHSLKEFRDLFWITFGVSTITSAVFVIFARTDIAKWNTPPKKSKRTKSM